LNPQTPRQAFETSPVLLLAMVVCLALILFEVATASPFPGAAGFVTDFDAFYVSGQMFWEGAMSDAYDPEVMNARQSALVDEPIFMPWTYPPQFNLVTAVLALAPRGLSYALFTAGTLVFYLVVLRLLAGRQMTGSLLIVFPSLAMVVLCGQNGLLTGGLIGLFCLLSLRARDAAGLPLGLMVVKPHLAIGLGLLVLFAGRWRVLAVALAVVAISTLAATAVLGLGIWPAFLDGTRAAGENMEAGLYKLFRMTSVYAALFSMGVGAGAALALHLAVAAAGIGAVLLALRRDWPASRVLGVAVFATLAVSPYNYDYDLAALAVGLALLSPDLVRHALPVERALLLLSGWICTGWGWVVYIFLSDGSGAGGESWVSLGGLGFVVMGLTVWRILLRADLARSEETRGIVRAGRPGPVSAF
jgi:hypothetical protein